MNLPEPLRPQVDRLQKQALIAGIAGLVLCAIFGFRDSSQFFRSYLFSYIFWVSIPLGCIGILMLHHLTGGWWGYPLRRLLEAGTRTLVFMALLYVPLWFGLSALYPWMKAGWVPDDSLHHFKLVYLSHTFFMARTVIYFVLLLLIVYLLNRWSGEQDRTADNRLAERLTKLSGIGVVIWGLVVSAAAFDWVMSLEPNWFSTIYGFIFIDLETLVALSFILFMLRRLSVCPPLKECIRPADYNDLGNLMLAFLLLWAYLSFSQFLLIWSGNLKDEIPYYMVRAFGGWGGVAVLLIIFHFFVPFFCLLMRPMKRSLNRLSGIAAYMIVLTLVDVYWQVVPAFMVAGPRIHWLDIFAVLGLGGLWLAAFLHQLGKRPLLPLHDPRFEGVLVNEHGD
ncbi:MAG TPA: hypothetical protein VMU43_07430 [Candidatus Acidoferrum sp.]|nr:hypothetical protein [Candidatus Acidoferrum sp.]